MHCRNRPGHLTRWTTGSHPMAVVAIQFVPGAMLRVAEVELECLCENCRALMAASLMADLTGREISSVRGGAGRVTLEAGCMSAGTRRYRERYAAIRWLVTGATSGI